MIKVAILEHEKETKDIVYLLSDFFSDLDWTFRHYFKASELAKKMKEESYQIFIFDEIFKTPRLESVFVHDNPSAIFVYVCADVKQVRQGDTRSRIYYVRKGHIEEDFREMKRELRAHSRQKEMYSLLYQGVKIEIPIEDIYFMEKKEKNVIFHTRKGIFQRRLNMSDLEAQLEPYGFLRVHVSFLVNGKYITSISKNSLVVNEHEIIPISRNQKRRLGLQVRQTV